MAEKVDMYAETTAMVVDALQQGTVPWRNPLIVKALSPVNLTTGKQYRGANRVLLSLVSQKLYRGCPYWLTYKQASDRGAHVKRGEHGTRILFWKFSHTEIVNTETSETEEKKIVFVRHYTGFNACQCEGLTTPAWEHQTATQHNDKIEKAEKIVADMPHRPAIVHHDQEQMFYSHGSDFINVPDMSRFSSAEEYYSSLFHELGHSTGHKSRLNRTFGKKFGDGDYSREELCAEITSAFLCAETGILPRTLQNSASYIAGWLRALRNDNKMFVSAAAAAQRAADYILGVKPETADN